MANYRNPKIVTFYNKKQVCFDNIKSSSYSKSPLKPYLLLKRMREKGFDNMLEVRGDFEPFVKNDFHIAHTKRYVDNVFTKKGNYASNGVPWSKNLVESLTYTNSALYNAKKHALLNPRSVTFAPISGMHHARPDSGSGFCTFSGQVISAIKIYQEYKAVGAYLDLDGHFGNSIEDSREFNPILNKAIPAGCNVNITGKNEEYVKNFDDALTRIGYDIIRGRIHYVVFCHGADSHADDDLNGDCNTKNWVKCAEIFAKWVNECSSFMGKPLPVVLTLFGGYRKDDYNAVLDLHMKSLIKCSNIICGNRYVDNLTIPEKPKYEYYNFETSRSSSKNTQSFKYWQKRRNNEKRMRLFGTIN